MKFCDISIHHVHNHMPDLCDEIFRLNVYNNVHCVVIVIYDIMIFIESYIICVALIIKGEEVMQYLIGIHYILFFSCI